MRLYKSVASQWGGGGEVRDGVVTLVSWQVNQLAIRPHIGPTIAWAGSPYARASIALNGCLAGMLGCLDGAALASIGERASGEGCLAALRHAYPRDQWDLLALLWSASGWAHLGTWASGI